MGDGGMRSVNVRCGVLKASVDPVRQRSYNKRLANKT